MTIINTILASVEQDDLQDEYSDTLGFSMIVFNKILINEYFSCYAEDIFMFHDYIFLT